MKKKKVTMKQLQRKRDAYLIEAQERMIIQKEKTIDALQGELMAAHLWIAHLLDRSIGDGEEITLKKEDISHANVAGYEYSDDAEAEVIRVRRIKVE